MSLTLIANYSNYIRH